MHGVKVLCVLISLFKLIDGTFVCPNDGMFENPNDHNSFWHCAHGHGFLKHCPVSLIWSQINQHCVWNVVTPTLAVTTTTLFSTATVTLSTTLTPSLLSPQCSNYISITDGTRHVSNTNLVDENDGTLFSSAPTWVRFEGAAGTRLANYSVSLNHCGSESTGWAKDTVEPEVGETANQTVCFNWNRFTCIWPTKIPMTNCDGFFVYALSKPAIAEARYCTI